MSDDGRRQLTDEERRLIGKRMEALQQDLTWARWEKAHAEIMVTQGLKANYMRQLAEYQVKLRNSNEDVTRISATIMALDHQLTHGVTGKEVTGEEE